MAEEKKKGDAEKSIQAFNAWIDDVVSYGNKVNENIVGVLSSVSGVAVHPGYTLQAFKERLGGVNQLNLVGLSNNDVEEVRKQITAIMAQHPRTGYDSDIVKSAIDKLMSLRKK